MDASPFRCDTCRPADIVGRNCGNHLGLSEAARAVDEYTEEISCELRQKSAKKVASLAGLRLYECPASYLTADTMEMQRAVFATQAFGKMPLDGGWVEQPGWFVEAYEIYRAERSAAMKDKGNGERH